MDSEMTTVRDVPLVRSKIKMTQNICCVIPIKISGYSFRVIYDLVSHPGVFIRRDVSTHVSKYRSPWGTKTI